MIAKSTNLTNTPGLASSKIGLKTQQRDRERGGEQREREKSDPHQQYAGNLQ
jgi:hypothetical protein